MDFTRPLPTPTPTSQPFWDGLNNHEVRLQHCEACNGWVFYPRSHCPHCLSDELTWQQVSGQGNVYSFTIALRPTAPQFSSEVPQLIAVVELAEGVRMNTLLVNTEEESLKVGMAVKPVFTAFEDCSLLFFEPA